MADSSAAVSTPEVPDNVLGMSDEELMNLDPSQFDAPAAPEEEVTPVAEDPVEPEGQADGEAVEPEPEGEAPEADGDVQPEAEEEEGDGDSPDADPEGEDEPEEPESAVDYKAEYERLLAPFRANGKDMQVKDVDEAVHLMQMGANYNLKMAALKPNLKILKLLEKNGLLEEEKLNFLIDVDKKNPEAITKLLKDSGVDPMDINVDAESDYKPNTYTVSDSEVELDTVLEEIKDSGAYTQTLDVVTNKWDGASKQAIVDNPNLLRVLNDQIASGVYELVSNEVQRERTFGRLKGLSDIQAYQQMGDAIAARGGFDHLVTGQAPVKKTVKPQPKPAANPALKDKKRAASPTKPAAPAAAQADFNPLALSDDEFEKLVKQNLL